MPQNFREVVEADLGEVLEGEFQLPIVLINSIDGATQTTSKNDPTKPLVGQVMYDTLVQDPDTGLSNVVNKPVAVLRISSLDRVPTKLDYKDKWIVKIPATPSPTAPLVAFSMSRPPEGGASHGFIRLYLDKVVQSP